MARKKKLTETMLLKVPGGTFASIARVLAPTEDRVELVRDAINREVRRRERAMKLTPLSFDAIKQHQEDVEDLRAEVGGTKVPDDWL